MTAAFLKNRGFSSSLLSHYVRTGWLRQPTRGVFTRPRRGELRWEQVVISLQTLLEFPLVVGGRTALELQNRAPPDRKRREVHVHGQKPLPSWVKKLELEQRFVFHKSSGLFRDDPPKRGLAKLTENVRPDQSIPLDQLHGDSAKLPWGQWNWPLIVSKPERALLEMLDELPDREKFHDVDGLFEDLGHQNHRRLQELLERCRRIKVKRLFLFFADRHAPQWLKHIDRGKIDLGKGDRMVVRGGKFDPVHRITVPADLPAVDDRRSL